MTPTTRLEYALYLFTQQYAQFM